MFKVERYEVNSKINQVNIVLPFLKEKEVKEKSIQRCTNQFSLSLIHDKINE